MNSILTGRLDRLFNHYTSSGPEAAAAWLPARNRKPAAKQAYGMILALFRKMIRKLKTGKYRLYSRKVDSSTGKRRNLGTFDTREAAEKHERAVQFFKRAH